MYLFAPTGLLHVVPRPWSTLGIFLCMDDIVCHWYLSNVIKFSLLIAYVWITVPTNSLMQPSVSSLLWLDSNFLNHGCSLVPGCVAQLSVAPSDGEQPDQGAPRCRFPCFR